MKFLKSLLRWSAKWHWWGVGRGQAAVSQDPWIICTKGIECRKAGEGWLELARGPDYWAKKVLEGSGF